MKKRCFLLAVVGESYRNPGGTSRQKIIQRCAVGEPLQLIREPNNRDDSNAMKVCRMNGEQIGHVSREDAFRLAPEVDAGQMFRADIYAINGGTPDKPSRGVVMRVGVLEADSVGSPNRSRSRTGQD